jgi:tripartite-type tricarboxylate transporter receptor subunit TctC
VTGSLLTLTSNALAAALACFVLSVLGANAVSAQDYPSKPVRIVTSSAGGTGDIISRLVSQEISTTLGQPVIVDNRPTFAAIDFAAKAPADGYTVLESGGAIWTTPLLQDATWQPLRDFSPITQIERTPNILVVHPSVPVTSVRELIALARSRPGVLNYSSPAAGTSSHLAGELFKSMAGVKLVWVPYKGSSQAALALISGEAHLAFANAGAIVPFINSGKLRAVAVTSLRPSALIPGLPTVAESGLPGFEVTSLDCFMVPARTSAAIIRRLHQEITPVLNRPDVKERLLKAGIEVVTSSPDELTATIKFEIAKWGKLIKEAGIRVN